METATSTARHSVRPIARPSSPPLHAAFEGSRTACLELPATDVSLRTPRAHVASDVAAAFVLPSERLLPALRSHRALREW